MEKRTCEGCDEPATTQDADGVPLCGGCSAELGASPALKLGLSDVLGPVVAARIEATLGEVAATQEAAAAVALHEGNRLLERVESNEGPDEPIPSIVEALELALEAAKAGGGS
jgi:hypothetical protein